MTTPEWISPHGDVVVALAGGLAVRGVAARDEVLVPASAVARLTLDPLEGLSWRERLALASAPEARELLLTLARRLASAAQQPPPTEPAPAPECTTRGELDRDHV